MKTVGRKLGIMNLSLPEKTYKATQINFDNGDMYLECNDGKLFIVFLRVINVNLLSNYQKALQMCHYSQNRNIRVGLINRDKFVFESSIDLHELKISNLLDTILALQSFSDNLAIVNKLETAVK